MREELKNVGFSELITSEEVDKTLNESKGTLLMVFNSVCGCAAGSARPGVRKAVENGKKPDKMVTVFAGQDVEATVQARKYTLPYPPSSPAIALFKDGKLVHFVERHNIEGRTANALAEHLQEVFKEFC